MSVKSLHSQPRAVVSDGRLTWQSPEGAVQTLALDTPAWFAWLPAGKSLLRSIVCLNQGYSAMADGNLADAEGAFTEALRLRGEVGIAPALPRAAYLLAQVQLLRGAPRRATQTLEVAEQDLHRPRTAAGPRLLC